MKIGVIGAGATGLAAAYDLTKDSNRVDVYESSYFTGGQASTIPVGGTPLERGYHHLFTNDSSIIELMSELGLETSLKWIKSSVGTYTQGQLFKTTTPIDLLTLSFLPIVDRLRLGLFTLYIKRINDWKKLEHITADTWLKEHLGDNLYTKLWAPLLRGKFGKDYDKVGMPWFWSKIQTRFASRKGLSGEILGYPTGSFNIIFDALETNIKSRRGQIFLSHKVKKIVHNGRKIIGLQFTDSSGVQKYEEYDLVICTAPSFEFIKLIDLPANYKSKLESVKYLGAVVLILELKHKLTDFYWLNIADNQMPFLGVIEHTNLIPSDIYNGHHVVYLTNYLDRTEETYSLSKNKLLEKYLPYIRKINQNFEKSWIINSHHNVLSAAQPVITTGYSQRIPAHQTPYEGLYLANTTQIYPEDRGTNYSIQMGRRVAKTVIEHKNKKIS